MGGSGRSMTLFYLPVKVAHEAVSRMPEAATLEAYKP